VTFPHAVEEGGLTVLAILRFALIAICGLSTTAAVATETITYTYDARGRLVQVQHSGTVNNGVSTTYAQDKANNRANVTTTGASH
jgi:YD repeat-containing protein